MMSLERLEEEQWNLLIELLEREHSELPVEIRHTRNAEVRNELHHRAEIVNDLLTRMRMPVAA